MTTRHYEVPPQLEDLLLEFTVNVLVNQPDNLVAYAVEYFTRLNESSNKYSGANNKLAPADTNNVQDGAASDQDDSMMSEDEGKPLEQTPSVGAHLSATDMIPDMVARYQSSCKLIFAI